MVDVKSDKWGWVLACAVRYWGAPERNDSEISQNRSKIASKAGHPVKMDNLAVFDTKGSVEVQGLLIRKKCHIGGLCILPGESRMRPKRAQFNAAEYRLS